LSGVTVDYGGGPVLDNVTFTVGRGERWGVVGRNGSGKTSLFNIITGTVEPTRGSVVRESGLRVTLLDQHRDFGDAVTVWDAAASPFAALHALEQSLHEQATALGALSGDGATLALARYDRDLERFSREGGYTMEAQVAAVLQGLGFDAVAARSQLLANLSGGERGRVGLARQLITPADVLLLDEPTNHLDLDTTRWLEGYLTTISATVILISHDRAFIEAVVDHVLHIEHTTATPYNGKYSAFVQQRSDRMYAQERAFTSQQKVIAAEEDYIRRNIAGGNSRQAKGRRTRLARLPRLTAQQGEQRAMSLDLETSARGGDQVLVARDVSVAVETRVLLRGFSTLVRRNEVIGMVGANGTGKSTLLHAIIGEHAPAAGTMRIGESISVAYYRQDMTQVPGDATIFSIIHDLRPLWNRGQVQSHLGRFGFSGDSVQRITDTLSGGERARVALAMLMLSKAGFLLLDEPTNHLDVESIEALEDALESFEGTILLVSHDRELLRGLVQRVWSLEDERITDFDGSFAEWEQAREIQRSERAREDSALDQARRDERKRAEKRAAEPEKARRASRQTLRRAVTAAEVRVAKLEQDAAELRSKLADPALYNDAAGVQQSVALKRELDTLDAELAAAFDDWSNATSEFEAAT